MAAKEQTERGNELSSKDRHSVGTEHEREDAYWREAHAREPYYNPERTYGDYQPAYRLGWSSRARYDHGTFDTYEPAFRTDWDNVKGESRLSWEEARHAARAGWDRFEGGMSEDADGR